MEITITTPALLFPTVSLIMLAYTNRFLALSSRVRELHTQYKLHPDNILKWQIQSLRHRVVLIRNMQAAGILSLIFCTVTMALLFFDLIAAGYVCFALALILLLVSLAISFREIQLSVDALNLHIDGMRSIAQRNEHSKREDELPVI